MTGTLLCLALMLPGLFAGFLVYALYVWTGWRWLLFFVALAYLLDVLANYSELAVLTLDWPRSGERTFSQRLHRLVQDPNRWGCIGVARILNRIVPNHIKGIN